MDAKIMDAQIYVQTETALSGCNGNNFTITDLTAYSIWVYSKTMLEIPKLIIGQYGLLFSVIDGDGGGGINISKFVAIVLPSLLLQMQLNPLFDVIPIYEHLRISVEQLNTCINNKLKLQDIWGSGWLSPALTSAIIKGDMMYFAQIGDSRAYLIRNNSIYQITKEQTLVRQLIDAGQISENEAKTHTYKNVMLQALGATPTINVIISGLKIVNGGIILLCTKEIIDKIELNDVKNIVINSRDNPQLICDKLFNVALSQPCLNMTLMLIEIRQKKLNQQIFDQMIYFPVIERDKNIPNEMLEGMFDFNT